MVDRHDRMFIQRLNSEPENIDLQLMPKTDRKGVLHAFAETIQSGTAPSFFPSGRDNIATLSIVEAAIRSSLQGGASTQIAMPH
jgi:hypothetical protein